MKYEKPSITIHEFKSENILTASGAGTTTAANIAGGLTSGSGGYTLDNQTKLDKVISFDWN